MTARHIAILTHGLTGGGVPRRTITLANALARRGRQVDLLVVDASGELRSRIDPAVALIDLGGWRVRLPFVRSRRQRQFRCVARTLERYMRRNVPDVLAGTDNQANLAALRAAAGSDCPVVIFQRNHPAPSVKSGKLRADLQSAYRRSHAVVAVSRGVADGVIALGAPAARVHVIYDPVVDDELAQAAARPIDHPWFGVPDRPVILGVGRIGEQKDFDTLMRAFAALKARGSSARLVILGEGKTPEARRDLRALGEHLGVAHDVDLPGYAPEAVSYIAKTDLFVLSSAWEGLGNVLIEAIACGRPVVSTDCLSGPSEILADGRVGRLVAVGDVEALAGAMEAELAAPRSPELLRAQAQLFTTDEAVARFLTLVDALAGRRSSIGAECGQG